MAKSEGLACSYCETEFGSKWARTEHEKTCLVKQSGELQRVQEALEWKREQVKKNADECYRYAARGFTAQHEGRREEAQRFLSWLAEDFDRLVQNLEELNQGTIEASKVHFPRMERMKREVGTLIEQAKDLQAIATTLNGVVRGGRG